MPVSDQQRTRQDETMIMINGGPPVAPACVLYIYIYIYIYISHTHVKDPVLVCKGVRLRWIVTYVKTPK